MTANNLLASTEELCKIIKTCAKNGILEFHFGDIHLVFGGINQSSKTLDAVETKPSEQEAKQISDEAEAQALAEQVRDGLEELKLTDPLAYERLIGAGDLEGGIAT